MGGTQRCSGFGLALETQQDPASLVGVDALEPILADQLDSRRPGQGLVAASPHLAHPTAADPLLEVVVRTLALIVRIREQRIRHEGREDSNRGAPA